MRVSGRDDQYDHVMYLVERIVCQIDCQLVLELGICLD